MDVLQATLNECGRAPDELDVAADRQRIVPELAVAPRLDPFEGIEFQTASARLAAEIALRNCAFRSTPAWMLRLSEVERVLSDNLAKVVEPSGRACGAQCRIENIGLAFAITEPLYPSDQFPSVELHASLALLLLVHSELARKEGQVVRAELLEKQALWCLVHLTTEGGRRLEHRRRSKSASVGARVLHEPHYRRKAAALQDYESGAWESKNQAAGALAKKHALAVSTVRKMLQGIRRESRVEQDKMPSPDSASHSP